MNPARAEYILNRERRPRDCPRRQWSPSWTSIMATGSVRGKCSARQLTHWRTSPPRPHLRPLAADRTVAVTVVPVELRAGLGDDSRLASADHGRRRAGVDEPDGRVVPEPRRTAPLVAGTCSAKWAAPSRSPRSTGSPSIPNHRTSSASSQLREAPSSSDRGTSSSGITKNLLLGSLARSASQPPSRRCWSPRSRGLSANTWGMYDMGALERGRLEPSAIEFPPLRRLRQAVGSLIQKIGTT